MQIVNRYSGNNAIPNNYKLLSIVSTYWFIVWRRMSGNMVTIWLGIWLYSYGVCKYVIQTNKGCNYQEKLKCILLANILYFVIQNLTQHVHRTSWYFRNGSQPSIDSSNLKSLMPCIWNEKAPIKNRGSGLVFSTWHCQTYQQKYKIINKKQLFY